MAFKRGTIVRIKMDKFMTYEDMELKPGPKLNILIGPNGSGKSTVICAIVLGLGGKPNIIGRARHVGDYVKHGNERATVEIELFNPNGSNFIVKRIMTTNGSSTWFLQGKAAVLKKVEELAKQLNIQVDNLCQLLPQDRVQDVAKMNSKELLENTQKMIEDQSIYESFERLKECRAKLVDLAIKIESLSKRHEEESHKRMGMENEVKNFKERRERLKKIASMNQKLAWLRYEEKAEKKKEAHEKQKDLQKKYEIKEKKLLPLKKELEELEIQENQMRNHLKKMRNERNLYSEKISTLSRNYHKHVTEAKQIQDDLKARLDAESRRESNIELLKKSIHSVKESLAENPEEALLLEIKKIDSEVESWQLRAGETRLREGVLRGKMSELNNSIRAIEFRIKQILNIKEKKVQLINQKKDVAAAYNWLEGHRHEFRGPIYGPIFSEINVVKDGCAKYVEQSIAYKDLVAFVCDFPEDLTKFMVTMREKLNLQVNGLLSTCKSSARGRVREFFRPKHPLPSLKPFGFHAFVSDVFECPDSVLWYLCKNYSLYNIPIGDNTTNRHSESIPQDIRIYYTDNECVTVRYSKYSKASTHAVNVVRKPSMLAFSVNNNHLVVLNEELKQKQTEAQRLNGEIQNQGEDMKHVDIEVNKHRGRKRTLVKILEQKKADTVRLRMKQKELKQMEEGELNWDQECEKAKTALIKWKNKIVTEGLACASAYKKLRIILCNIYKTEIKLDGIVSPLSKEKERELSNQKDSIKDLKNEVQKLTVEFEKIRRECNDLLGKAKELTFGLGPDDHDFKRDIVPLFKKFPNNIEELQDLITEFEAMARHLKNPDEEAIVRSYKECKQMMETLSSQLQVAKASSFSVEEEVKRLKDHWLPKLESLIQNISQKFSAFFDSMNCVGVVELDKGVNEEEYEKYGLSIKVKFRDENDLQTLDAYVQSGGERALTTAVFLLSLQGITNVPFRCVDEINQGLDEVNERRVYELLFGTISQSDTAQYFLLTPKLLDDIEYSEDCTIHCIYSGSHTVHYRDWSIEEAEKALHETSMDCS